MFKKTLITLILLITLVGCSNKGEYIPTALITNLTYNEANEILEFQVDISDKSNTIKNATVEIYKDQEKQETQEYNINKTKYTFKQVENDENYTIYIKAEYTVNGITVENKEIYTYNITNIISTQKPYFLNKTIEYDGETHSIFLENIDETQYYIAYSGNGVSEIGTHKVTALVSLNDEVVGRYEAYIVITQATPQLVAYDQTFEYTGEAVEINYELTPEVEINITYNGEVNPPVNVGIYEVVLTTVETTEQKETSKTIYLEITKANIEVYASNETVIYDGEIHEIEINTNIDCEIEVQYIQNEEEVIPQEAGIYEVIITIKDTENYNGLIKILTLEIVEETVQTITTELMISQFSYLNEQDIVLEIFNPTATSISLNEYSILLGTSNNGKIITLNNVVVEPYTTYTLASTTTTYTSIIFNQYSNFLVYDNTISLIKNNEIIDELNLIQPQNLVRKPSIDCPNKVYSSGEWEITNSSLTFNNHKLSFTVNNTSSHIEVLYSYNIILNYGTVLDYNDYIEIFDEIDGKILITDEMHETSVDVYKLGIQEVKFIVTNSSLNKKEFTINFEVKDIAGPTFVITNDSLVFEKNQEIDFESLVTATDNFDEEVEFTIDSTAVDNTQSGAYKVVYKSTDTSGNETLFTIYIFIE